MDLHLGQSRASTSAQGLESETAQRSDRTTAAALAYVGSVWVTLLHHLGSGMALEPVTVLDALRDGSLVLPLVMLVVASRSGSAA